MTEFLIKSSFTMAVLLGLYYLLFEREKMHRFNRFYLLSALVFSLALPFITVITYVLEIEVPAGQSLITSKPDTLVLPAAQPTDYLFYIGWGIYVIVTLILVIRFVKNVTAFIKRSSVNSSVKMENATLVLLEEKVLPHTFLNYIFVNREEYEARLIEEELFTHELTHVKQKHTLDILFLEALKTIFWFNPLFYCYKKAIQLNHEFLADEKVIDTTANTIYYQNLLLEKTSVGATFSMASNLTFSLTKKRFVMMTKTTSTIKAGFLKMIIFSVIVTLMMFLCTKTIAQETTKSDSEEQARIDKMLVSDKEMDSLKKVNPEVFSDDLNIRFKGTKFRFTDKKGNVIQKIGYKNLTEKEKKSIYPDMFGVGLVEVHETPDETDPEFPGGESALSDFLVGNIKLPKSEKDIYIEVKYSFIVKSDGSLSDFAVKNGSSLGNDEKEIFPELQTEVMRLIKSFPKWKPGTQDDKPINSNITRSLTIHLEAKP